jgi:hypothetical protein
VKKSKKTENFGLEDAMKSFFQSEIALLASQGLSERACIALHLEGKDYFFCRKKGRNQLLEESPSDADVHFWIPLSTMRHLLALSEMPGTGMGTMGVAIFEYLLHKDPAKKIKFRVDTAFLGLWSKGYFSVLKAGGPEVASYLARIGFGSLSKIKDTLRQFRG